MIRWIKTHPYCLINLYLVFYLIGFFALEAFVPEPKYIIHSALDDWIPLMNGSYCRIFYGTCGCRDFFFISC